MDRSSGAKPIRNPRLTASGDPPAAKDGGIAGEAGERVRNGPTRIESQMTGQGSGGHTWARASAWIGGSLDCHREQRDWNGSTPEKRRICRKASRRQADHGVRPIIAPKGHETPFPSPSGRSGGAREFTGRGCSLDHGVRRRLVPGTRRRDRMWHMDVPAATHGNAADAHVGLGHGIRKCPEVSPSSILHPPPPLPWPGDRHPLLITLIPLGPGPGG